MAQYHFNYIEAGNSPSSDFHAVEIVILSYI
jgi:hypothetical protein